MVSSHNNCVSNSAPIHSPVILPYASNARPSHRSVGISKMVSSSIVVRILAILSSIYAHDIRCKCGKPYFHACTSHYTNPWRNFAAFCCSMVFVNTISPLQSWPVTTQTNAINYDSNDITRLKQGLREVHYLVDNWETKTVFCNYGEVQRDMLRPENKKMLLKAAAETGLLDYDKSATMVTMCKKDPMLVRALLGLTPDNLSLNRAELLMKKSSTVDRVDSDDIDGYFEAVEAYTRAVADVDSLTYGARADYGSTEIFLKENSKSVTSSKDYLEQSRASVVAAKNALEIIVKDLHL